MKVLIWESDALLRRALVHRLPWQDMQFAPVLEASSGPDAMGMALAESPDVIIMGEIPSGTDLISRLLQALPGCRVILLSVFSQGDMLRRSFRSGVYDVAPRPITDVQMQSLCQVIRKAADDIMRERCLLQLQLDAAPLREAIRPLLQEGNVQALRDAYLHFFQSHILPRDGALFTLTWLGALVDEACEIAPSPDEICALRPSLLQGVEACRSREALLRFTQDACRRCVALCSAQPALSSSHCQRMVRYIHAHYMDPELSVAQISQQMHLSPIYTGALFKKNQGCSVVTYIHRVRINQARKLLRDAALSIRDVSQQVGYITPDYFTRMFTRLVGAAPSRYRTQMMEKEQESL